MLNLFNLLKTLSASQLTEICAFSGQLEPNEQIDSIETYTDNNDVISFSVTVRNSLVNTVYNTSADVYVEHNDIKAIVHH